MSIITLQGCLGTVVESQNVLDGLRSRGTERVLGA